MTTSNATPSNIADLASLFGFVPTAAEAWLRCESQTIPNPTNPLNIRYSPTAIGSNPAGFAVFPSAAAGLVTAHNLVYGLSPHYGYGAIVAQRGSGDAMAQAAAIEHSSWAAGHYGGIGANLGCLRRWVAAHPVTPAPPAGVERMISAQVTERWHPTTNADGSSNGVLRGVPDRAAPVVGRIPAGGSIVTVAEISTGATGHNGADGNWRLVQTADRTVRYALRSDWISDGFLP